ncbi:MAG: cytosine deaminase [Bauldia sp.]
MPKGFASVPRQQRYVIANATIPAALMEALPTPADAEGLVAADITVKNGAVERIDPPGRRTRLPRVDLDGGMVWPAFVDMHTHIDKGHIWPRKPNPDGTFTGALEAVHADRDARWTAADVRARMEFSLRCAYAHGTALLRTHIDSLPPQHGISWPVFAEMRDRWAGRIELQAVALYPIDAILDDHFAADLTRTLREHGGHLGAATFMIPELDRALDRIFRIAIENGFDLDFHVDDAEDPEVRSLRHVADAALRLRFSGRINVGHCCSLALQPKAEAEETMRLVAEAGISVVSLPMCNMYLQDRHAGRTPRWRGVTLLHEMQARGIGVAVSSDNTRDPFYAYGDLDPVEVFREAVRILQLDHPIGNWPAAITRSPAEILRRADFGVVAPGRTADLVLFRARTWTEFLARPQSDRIVIRAGRAIDRRLPDYRELDALMDSPR